jgi:hypothetical protein
MITDPALLLGPEAPSSRREAPTLPPDSETPRSGPLVRLRDNETLARVSGAGVVIRRGAK